MIHETLVRNRAPAFFPQSIQEKRCPGQQSLYPHCYGPTGIFSKTLVQLCARTAFSCRMIDSAVMLAWRRHQQEHCLDQWRFIKAFLLPYQSWYEQKDRHLSWCNDPQTCFMHIQHNQHWKEGQSGLDMILSCSSIVFCSYPAWLLWCEAAVLPYFATDYRGQ